MTTTTAETILFENDTRKISRHNYQGYTLIVDSGPYTIVRDYIFHTGQTITETYRHSRRNPLANQTLWKVDGELTGAGKAERLLAELLAQNPQVGTLVKAADQKIEVAQVSVGAKVLYQGSCKRTVVARTDTYLNQDEECVTLVLSNYMGWSRPIEYRADDLLDLAP